MLQPPFLVMLVTFWARVQSIRSGALRLSYDPIDKGAEPPPLVAKTTNHFANLFEMPVLFYVVVVLLITLQVQSQVAVIAAWLFVGFRALHALVHITYNNVNHRLLAFSLSNICIVTISVVLASNIP